MLCATRLAIVVNAFFHAAQLKALFLCFALELAAIQRLTFRGQVFFRLRAFVIARLVGVITGLRWRYQPTINRDQAEHKHHDSEQTGGKSVHAEPALPKLPVTNIILARSGTDRTGFHGVAANRLAFSYLTKKMPR